MTNSIAEIEAEIERERAMLDAKLSELQARLTPSNLAGEALSAIGVGRGAGRGSLMDRGLALGANWLRDRGRYQTRPHLSRGHAFYGDADGFHRRFDDPDALRDARLKVTDGAAGPTFPDLGSALADARHETRHLRDKLADAAKEHGEAAVQALQEELARLEEKMAYTARLTRDEVAETYDRRPLQAGMAAFAAGVLLALLNQRR